MCKFLFNRCFQRIICPTWCRTTIRIVLAYSRIKNVSDSFFVKIQGTNIKINIRNYRVKWSVQIYHGKRIVM